MTESNFHKWNEPLYYEIINLICSKGSITYKELLPLLDKQKENFHLKYLVNGRYIKIKKNANYMKRRDAKCVGVNVPQKKGSI